MGGAGNVLSAKHSERFTAYRLPSTVFSEHTHDEASQHSADTFDVDQQLCQNRLISDLDAYREKSLCLYLAC